MKTQFNLSKGTKLILNKFVLSYLKQVADYCIKIANKVSLNKDDLFADNLVNATILVCFLSGFI